MIGQLVFEGRDGRRAMSFRGASNLAQLVTLAGDLQAYTNAKIVEARLWVPQELTGMNTPVEEIGFDLASTKAILTFYRSGQPAGKPPVARMSWPAPKGSMFELVGARRGQKGGGYRVKSTVGLSFASLLSAQTNRTLTFSEGWLKE